MCISSDSHDFYPKEAIHTSKESIGTTSGNYDPAEIVIIHWLNFKGTKSIKM